METEFRELKELLKKHSKGLKGTEEVFKSKAKTKKMSYHLYGTKEVSIIPKRKPQPTYVAGIIKQKSFIGFYFMPIYSHPHNFEIKNPELKKALKGKSCFHIKKLDKNIIFELNEMLAKGIEFYRKENWI